MVLSPSVVVSGRTTSLGLRALARRDAVCCFEDLDFGGPGKWRTSERNRGDRRERNLGRQPRGTNRLREQSLAPSALQPPNKCVTGSLKRI
jgi:hypothetical protein